MLNVVEQLTNADCFFFTAEKQRFYLRISYKRRVRKAKSIYSFTIFAVFFCFRGFSIDVSTLNIVEKH